MTGIEFILAVAVLVAAHVCVRIFAWLVKSINRCYGAIVRRLTRYLVRREINELSNENQKLNAKLMVANHVVAKLTKQNRQLELLVHELMQAGDALGHRSQQDYGRSAGREAS